MVTTITGCRICRSARIKLILNFGQFPLANRYLTREQLSEAEPSIPLELVLCLNCGCVQLAVTVDPKVLFEEYFYTSSTSGTLANHFQQYAQDVADKLPIQPETDLIVEIGGNDGPLALAFQNLGFRSLNIEASKNIAELSRKNGVETINDWFTEEAAESIVGKYGHASIITCNNCFAHIPDIHEVVRAIRILVAPAGWFICENARWLSAVQGNHFDQIYHEHCFYWTVKALERLFKGHGMTVADVELNQSQGGSMRVFVRHAQSRTPDKITGLIHGEEDAGLFRVSTYTKWSRRIEAWKKLCLKFLGELGSLSCYGVPAKFTMLSQQLSFSAHKIQYAVEDSPIKIGRYTPGSHIPIVSRNFFVEHPTEYCIITASNYADLIVKSNPQYKGKWILLTPEPHFLDVHV